MSAQIDAADTETLTESIPVDKLDTSESLETAPAVEGNRSEGVREDEASLGGPRFSPPLYRQRYLFCADVLAKYEIKSVVDFGCAECQLMMYLKQVRCLETVALVDKHLGSLVSNRHKIRPLITDHLGPRENPLTVTMYHGSITQFDSRLAGIQAVTMVELIEHLPDSELREFPMTVFGKLRPQVVIVTTPNAEFNQLFPGLTGFRHWDHKFEWTRQEFQDWCTEQATLFDYEVEFSGVGMGPPGSEPLGFCSQAAIFVSKPRHENNLYEESLPYTVIASSEHPYHRETRSKAERAELEVRYYVQDMAKDQDLWDDCGAAVIPVENLFRYVKLKDFFDSAESLREYLVEHGYRLSEDKCCVLYTLEVESSDEGVEWGCQSSGDGQFSDAEDDTSLATFGKEPWKPPDIEEEMWD